MQQTVREGEGVQIPSEILEELGIAAGQEVALRVENGRLIVEALARKRTRLAIKPEIIDELVEREELFSPEAAD